MITAKVKLESKTPASVGTNGDPATVRLNFGPDYQDDANKEWALRTPSLQLVMTVVEDVAARYEVGDKITLVFQGRDEQEFVVAEA